MARPLRLEYEGAVYHLTTRGNERIARISGSTWFATYRDESDRLSSEYTITSTAFTRTKDYFHFGNMLVSTLAGGNYSFYSSDHLGTPRLVTDVNGHVLEAHKYFPYGQEITGSFGAQPLKFALMERDQTSTNDFDLARFHLTGMGRFLGVDRLGGDISIPNSLNGYVYANSNPLKFSDPDGQAPWLAIGISLAAGTIEGGYRAGSYALGHTSASRADIRREFGIGFAGGFAGGLAGTAVAEFAGPNPIVVGGAGSLVDGLVVQSLEIHFNERASPDYWDLALDAVSGAVLGKALDKLMPLGRGRVPKYFGNRSFKEFIASKHPNVQGVFRRDVIGSFFGTVTSGLRKVFGDSGETSPYGQGYSNFQEFLFQYNHPGYSVGVSANVCPTQPCPAAPPN